MGGDFTGQPSATILSTSVTMISNLVGAGIVSLPYTLKRAGIVPGVIAMILMAFLNAFSALVIAQCCELVQRFNYKDVAVAALGKRAAFWVGVTLIIYTVGSCVAFTCIIGDLLPDLIKAAIDASCNGPCTGGAATAREIFGRSEVMIVITGSVFLYPLALNRNLDALKFTSTLSFLSIVYVFLMLLSLVIIGPPAPKSDLNIGGNGDGIFVAFPILLVALTFHYNVPKTYGELKDRSLKRYAAAIAIAFGFVLVLYLGAGLCGYILKGSQTVGDILNAFGDGSAVITIARIALSIVVISCFPLAFNSLRAAFVSVLPAAWGERIKHPYYDPSLSYLPVPSSSTAADSGSVNKGETVLVVDDGSGSASSRCTELSKKLLSSSSGSGGDVAAAAGVVDSSSVSPPAANEHCVLFRLGSRCACKCLTCRACCIRVRADWPHATVTKLLVLLSLTIAILVPTIETILGYKGAIGGSLVVIIFPAWMYFALTTKQKSLAASATSDPAAARGEELASLPFVFNWRDLYRTGYGLGTSAATIGGLILMVSGTLAAAKVIGSQ